MPNAADSRWLGEALGVMATGTPEEVLEYAERLRDLEEFGMEKDLQKLKQLARQLEEAEQARREASRKFHAAAEQLLGAAQANWSTAEVILALFGER